MLHFARFKIIQVRSVGEDRAGLAKTSSSALPLGVRCFSPASLVRILMSG